MEKAQVLIVEGDGIIAMDIESRLKQLGYGVTAIVGYGEEAIEKVKENTPDVVLMDIVLIDEIDGIEAADQIRTQFNIPVIFLTDYVDKERLKRAKLTNSFGFIIKPFQNKDLEVTIEMALYIAKVDAERKQAEEALRESEKHFRQLAEGTFEAIVLHAEGVILEANEQFYEMFGYNPGELTGKDVISLTTTPESAEKIREQISLGNLGPYEITGVKKDGTKFPMESRIKLIAYKGRKVRMAAIQDITERKLSEKALRESEERFRDTATMLPSVIIEYGFDGILTYVNPHGYELAGYVPEDFAEGFHVLRLVAPEEHAQHYERIQRMMQGEKIPPTEYRLLGKDGSILWGLVTSSLIHKDGEVVGVRTYVIDITERKEAEEALKERTRELELQKKSLEELNIAMKVLLKKREDDKIEIKDNVMTNVKKLITPYFIKIQKTKLDNHQKAFLNILESNLNEIVSPFTRKLSLKYLSLTPKEITIVNMIKQDYTTKKIAKLMKISPRTVDTHRKNIRSKIGLNKKKGNLRSHLLAYEQ